jgi:transcriptional regulator with XRE-family HTH domain
MVNIFPKQLKNLREREGYTLEKIAELLGFKTKQRVWDYENSRSEPSLEEVVKIATFFNVSLDYLLTGTEKPVQSESEQVKEWIKKHDELQMLVDELSTDLEQVTKERAILRGQLKKKAS